MRTRTQEFPAYWPEVSAYDPRVTCIAVGPMDNMTALDLLSILQGVGVYCAVAWNWPWVNRAEVWWLGTAEEHTEVYNWATSASKEAKTAKTRAERRMIARLVQTTLEDLYRKPLDLSELNALLQQAMEK